MLCGAKLPILFSLHWKKSPWRTERRVKSAKRKSRLRDFFFFVGEGGDRTLARDNPANGLANRPLNRLGTSPNPLRYIKTVRFCLSRREWDSNPRLFRVTGFQDRLLKPLGHLSTYTTHTIITDITLYVNVFLLSY